MKPRHELSEVVQLYGTAFLEKHPQRFQVIKTLDAIARCRTASLGGHVCSCTTCGHKRYFYNSCRNRHCPKCQAINREKWIVQREAELLPVTYFHMVFTLPEELRPLALKHPKEVYNALFSAAWNTVKTLSGDPKYLGAKPGMVAILHTWGQQLWLHPHVHCIVPSGGVTSKGKWKNNRHKGKYLFPQKAMSKIYRAKFMAYLRAAGVVIPQPVAKAVFSKTWIVYAKRPFSSPATVIEYLARYTHKVAISNHRLISVDNKKVCFHYKDYRQAGIKKQTTMEASEFLRRFCQHILPKGFVRIRHYGILASKNKAKELNLAKTDLGLEKWEKVKVSWKTIALEKLKTNPDACPKCPKGILEVVDSILPTRGPPLFKLKANLNFLQE